MKLEESTFMLYASKYYDNPNCHSIEEFEEDLQRIKYIKKLFSKYKKNGELNERLILNHIIIFYNCFGEKATNILFMKLDKYHSYLKPFISYLNYLPVTIEYNKKIIYTETIKDDENVKFIVESMW